MGRRTHSCPSSATTRLVNAALVFGIADAAACRRSELSMPFSTESRAALGIGTGGVGTLTISSSDPSGACATTRRLSCHPVYRRSSGPRAISDSRPKGTGRNWNRPSSETNMLRWRRTVKSVSFGPPSRSESARGDSGARRRSGGHPATDFGHQCGAGHPNPNGEAVCSDTRHPLPG